MSNSINKSDIITDLLIKAREKKAKIKSSMMIPKLKKEKINIKLDSISFIKDANAEKTLNEYIKLCDSILESKNKSKKIMRDNVKEFGISMLLIVSLSSVVYFILAPSSEDIQKEREEKRERNQKGNKHGAWAYAKIYVEKQLKSPSSADFPFGGAEDVTHVRNGLYMFRSYVDSQNSFGATLRTHFEGNIQKVDGGWEIVNFRFVK